MLRSKHIIGPLLLLLSLTVFSVALNAAWATPTITPSTPKAGTPFTISGTTAGGTVVTLYIGSACTGSSAFIGSSPGGSYSFTVTEPAGSYSVSDASGCVHFTVH